MRSIARGAMLLLLSLVAATACLELEQQTAGDARCDAAANTEECEWDGGDCCAMTCRGALCGKHGYECRDPAHADTAEEAQAEEDCDGGRHGGGGSVALGWLIVGGGFGGVAALTIWTHIQWQHRFGSTTAPKETAVDARVDAVELTTVVSADDGAGLAELEAGGGDACGAHGIMAWTEYDALSRLARPRARTGPRSRSVPLPVARPSTPVEATSAAARGGVVPRPLSPADMADLPVASASPA